MSDVHLDPEPVHAWFCLSYANYFVMQRAVLQSMPVQWQRQFVRLIQQIPETLDMEPVPTSFRVHAVDERGKYRRDEYSDYQRGRRQLPRRSGPRP